MAKLKEKKIALKMRQMEFSYTKIKSKLGVSKSTLSSWLKDLPLSRERINKLRSNNSERIEKFRNTMRGKREAELQKVFAKVKKEIGPLTKRDILIGGVFLYWGEGSKTASYTTSVSNTDPDVLRFFVKWLSLFGIRRDMLRVKLHLYNDMDVSKEVNFWIKELKIPRKCFSIPYIKKSKLSELSYGKGFGHGTCNVKYHDKNMWHYSLMALKYIKMASV